MQIVNIKINPIHQRRKDVKMKKTLIFLICFIASIRIHAQQIKNPKKHLQQYAEMINSFYYTQPPRPLPKYFSVQGNVLEYISEFLKEKSTSPKVKEYILNHNWLFLKKIDTTEFTKRYQTIKLKQLKPYLKKELSVQSNLDIYHVFSPFVVSFDCKKAFVVSQLSSRTEVIEISVYFFEIKNGKWKLVKSMISYLI